MTPTYDIAIIGGGINGCGIALEAAQKGLRVFLAERADLGSGTSSYSSKLIHGGLRYLEQGHIGLVKKALRERDILLKKAPHLVQPQAFIVPCGAQSRPRWLIGAGLWIYDQLAKSHLLATSHTLSREQHPAFYPLEKNYRKGFVFSDCYADDTRLVIANALGAKKFGADIYNYRGCQKAHRCREGWKLTLSNGATIKAKALVNAAGPWADRINDHVLENTNQKRLTLIKGSHLIIPKTYESNDAYLLQHTDKRIVFVIPFHEKYLLLGTTEVTYNGDPGKAQCSQKEIDYLCQLYNQYFAKKITSKNILTTFSGVRPLLPKKQKKASAISRDYQIELQHEKDDAPLLQIWGGKLTTYRQLAQDALNKLTPFFPELNSNHTLDFPLPGGDIQSLPDFVFELHQRYPFLPEALVHRYAKSYGSLCEDFLAGCSKIQHLGQTLGHGLYEAEIDYLCQEEWAQTAEDILWRRTKLGLAFTETDIRNLTRFLASRGYSKP